MIATSKSHGYHLLDWCKSHYGFGQLNKTKLSENVILINLKAEMREHPANGHTTYTPSACVHKKQREAMQQVKDMKTTEPIRIYWKSIWKQQRTVKIYAHTNNGWMQGPCYKAKGNRVSETCWTLKDKNLASFLTIQDEGIPHTRVTAESGKK